MIEDALNGFHGNARCRTALLFVVVMSLGLFMAFGLALQGVIHMVDAQVVCNNTRLLMATETDQTIKAGAPTEVGTNNNPMEWDRHYARMLPERISCVLAYVHVIYRTQAQLNAYQASQGQNVLKSWDGSSRAAAAAFYAPNKYTVYLSSDGKWSYATVNGEKHSVVMHELGHAYDFVSGNLSRTAKYNFTKEPCFQGDSYYKDSQEAFAQVFSIYFTGNRSSLSAHAQACMAEFAKD